jgi:hypothetical protein
LHLTAENIIADALDPDHLDVALGTIINNTL